MALRSTCWCARVIQQEAQLRLWRALQLHLEFPRFYEYLQTKMRIFCGDLTSPGFGLGRDEYDRLVHTTDSVIHCAASLNRKSEKSCLNVNLRGTLEVLTLARQAEHYHGLRRFSEVSTVAVAGKRSNEVVTEDQSIEWDRSDYDPYARTKKFCEHMTRVLAAGYAEDDFPPEHCSRRQPPRGNYSVRYGEGIRISSGPAGAAVPSERQDRHRQRRFCRRCDCDTCTRRIEPNFDTYHLSSGTSSQTFRELTTALAAAQQKRKPVFVALCREALYWIGQLSLQPEGSESVMAHPAESVHALSGVEHRVRQHACDFGVGTQTCSVFAVQLSPAEVQPREQFRIQLPAVARGCAEVPPHDGLRP